MFYDCTSLRTLNLSNFNTANVMYMDAMFGNCTTIATIYGGDWVKNAGLSSAGMFSGCTSLVGGNGTSYNYNHIDATYARIDRAGTPGYFTRA